MAAMSYPPLWLVTVLFACLAALNGFAIVAFTHARPIFPDRLMGRGLTIFTLAPVAGSAVMQMLSGPILGAFSESNGAVDEMGYRLMFLFLGASVIMALLFYLRVPDAKPSDDPPMHMS